MHLASGCTVDCAATGNIFGGNSILVLGVVICIVFIAAKLWRH